MKLYSKATNKFLYKLGAARKVATQLDADGRLYIDVPTEAVPQLLEVYPDLLSKVAPKKVHDSTVEDNK